MLESLSRVLKAWVFGLAALDFRAKAVEEASPEILEVWEFGPAGCLVLRLPLKGSIRATFRVILLEFRVLRVPLKGSRGLGFLVGCLVLSKEWGNGYWRGRLLGIV